MLNNNIRLTPSANWGWVFFVLLIFVLSGCIPSANDRFLHTSSQAKNSDFSQNIFVSDKFAINYFLSNKIDKNKELNIFIEGDGFSWVDKYTPSDNPTPINPIALQIALGFGDTNIVYLSRPCQNVFGDNFKNCGQKYWTRDRFAPEVINSLNETIEYIKTKSDIQKINLFGYSGGGVAALLIASKRSDVGKVTTYASNIDTAFWTKLHNVSELSGENPADLCDKLSQIPQVHFVGGDDHIVPQDVARSYLSKCQKNKHIDIIIIDGFEHSSEWEQCDCK